MPTFQRVTLVLITTVFSLVLTGTVLAQLNQLPPAALPVQQTPAAGQPDTGTCNELQLIFIVDQSGSMFGFTDDNGVFHAATDPNGLRFYSPEAAANILANLHYQAYPQSTMQMAMIYFGNNAQTAMPWTTISPTTASEYTQTVRALAPYFVPLANSLGDTAPATAFDAASSLFTQVPQPVNGCPIRLIIAITDGQPAIEQPGFTWQQHLQDLATYTRQYMASPDHQVYVIGLDANNDYWPRVESFWQQVTGDPSHVGRVNNEADMAARLLAILNQAVSSLTISGASYTVSCITSQGPLAIPPYIKQIQFTLIKTSPGLHLEVRDPNGALYNNNSPGLVQGYNDPIESMTINNPQPGMWEILTQVPPSTPELCQLLMFAFDAHHNLIEPATGATPIQYQEMQITFEILDGNGLPLPSYTDNNYQLDVNVTLVGASGSEQVVGLGANPGQQYNGVVVPLEAGPTVLHVEGTSHRPLEINSYTVYSADISTFQVQPVGLQIIQSPPALTRQYEPFPIAFTLTASGQQGIELDYPVLITGTMTYSDAITAVPLDFLEFAGVYTTTFKPEVPGDFTLTYRASVNTPIGNRLISEDTLPFSVTPVQLVSLRFESPERVIATDPLLRPTGLDVRVQMVDETGRPVGPGEVGAVDPTQIFTIQIIDENDNDLSDQVALVNTGQPGHFRLQANKLGVGTYEVTVQPATDLDSNHLWAEPSVWTAKVIGQIHPTFYVLASVAGLGLLAAVLGGVSFARLFQHPFAGTIEIYQDGLLGPDNEPQTRTIMSQGLPKRNRFTFRVDAARGGECARVTKVTVYSPSEALAREGRVKVKVYIQGNRRPREMLLLPGEPIPLSPNCFIVKDRRPNLKRDDDTLLEDTFY